jgi:hypothetical protein
MGIKFEYEIEIQNKVRSKMAEELFIQLQGNHQEIIFPAALVDPIGEVSVKQHDSNVLNLYLL